ncbi:hypothetical protein FACS189434_08020 [Bacteroidia bacterium]|nr:hypothetical protein FACS189434_08020 [Bacteroidia bacterium]
MFTINITGIDEVKNKLEQLKNSEIDNILLAIATRLQGDIHKRVHVDGLDSDGSPIGTYSKDYMKVRTGNYPETTLKSGKNKGNFREKKKTGQAGVFTKGKNKGKSRPTYNRKNDTAVILSLSTQMEESMNVQEVAGGYGIGYSNELAYNKAIWNEARYKKDIWKPTEEEIQTIKNILIEKLREIFD